MTLVGDGARIPELCAEHGLAVDALQVIDEPDVMAAGAKAVAMPRHEDTGFSFNLRREYAYQLAP